MAETTRCQGCGLELPETGGPTHRYLGASAECWAVFGRVLASHYEDAVTLGGIHRLVVDAYAAQHPDGQPDKSVGVHLVGLQLSIEEGLAEHQVNELTQRLIAAAESYPVFDPPADRGSLTVADLAAADDATEQRELSERWARLVWQAWEHERPKVYELRSLLD